MGKLGQEKMSKQVFAPQIYHYIQQAKNAPDALDKKTTKLTSLLYELMSSIWYPIDEALIAESGY